MNNIRDLNVRYFFPALMAAVVLCFGCATSRSKHSGSANEIQTASAQQPVILVPVFILSPPDNDTTHGKDRLPAPQPPFPEQSIEGRPAPPSEPFTHL